MFDFQYGEEFGAHIERFDPDFTKVLVRYNPDGDAAENGEQLSKLKRLSDWLAAHDRKFLFELARARRGRPAAGGGRRLGALRRRAASRADAPHDRRDPGRWNRGRHLEDRGRRRALRLRNARRPSPDRRTRWRRVRSPGPGRRRCEFDHWLTQAAPVDGFVGFAIGRSIWWDPLKAYVDGKIDPRRGGAEDRRELPALRRRLRARQDVPVRMRQSLSELEREFAKEISLERRRRASLRRTTEQRAFKREVDRRQRRGSVRFVLLVLTLIATAVIVTVVMFRTLYLLLG